MFDNFTDLVLLIGTNPLPNYVIAKYFLKTNSNLSKIWLIHSEKVNEQENTGEFAENIREVILEEPDIRKPGFEFISLKDAGSAFAIKSDLENKFFNKLSGNERMHLNYTGGTKSMAVHVYRNLEHRLKNNCSFSYLDARSHRLKSDDSRDAISNDLRNDVSITFDNLIKLHGYEKSKKEDSFNPDQVGYILDTFEALINENRLDDAYLKWKENFIRTVYYKDNDFIYKKNAFLEHNGILCNGVIDKSKINDLKRYFELETPAEVKKILTALPENESILDDKGDLWIPDLNTPNSDFKKRLSGPVKNFLDGKWLESYVKRILQDALTNDSELSNKYCSNLIPVESNWVIHKRSIKKTFELDVILLNGYQVCGISCTTSKEPICKEKAFEILHRVKQIGGEEARAVLVSCLEEERRDEFANDIRNISGSSKSDFIVLSLSDLKREKLWKQVREHIWGVE